MTLTRAGPPSDVVGETALGWLRLPDAARIAAETASWQAQEWETARWTVQVHGVAPLLCQRLQGNSALAAVAPPLQAYLAEQHRLTGMRAMAMMAELVAVLRAAGAAGIEVMPLKGAALLFGFYDDPALRPMSDLDLLVRPDAEARLAEVLPNLGYLESHRDTTLRHRSFYLARLGRHAAYSDGEHPDNPHRLELHTRIWEQCQCLSYEMTEDLWANSRGSLFSDAPALSPQPAALLQHLLVHCTADMVAGRMRLICLYDIALVATRLTAADWRQLLLAGRWRREERALCAPLVLAARYFPAVAPVDIMERLAAGTPPRLLTYLGSAHACHLSFCNQLPASLAENRTADFPRAERLVWCRSDWERLSVLRRLLLPTPGEVHPRYQDLPQSYPLLLAYLVRVQRALLWPLGQLLGLPRRAWIYRQQGGKPEKASRGARGICAASD